jgi:IclR family acetate operon transcriptional repressor
MLVEADLKPMTPRTITTVDGLIEELERIRLRGYAIDDEEAMPGLRCIGAPIWSVDGVFASLSVSGSILIITKDRIEEIAKEVLQAANSISAQLGAIPQHSE